MSYSTQTLTIFSEVLGALYSAETPEAALQSMLPKLGALLGARQIPMDGDRPLADQTRVSGPVQHSASAASCCRIFQPDAIRDQLCLAAQLTHSAVTVTFQRAKFFTEEEVQLVAMLRPHVAAVVKGRERQPGASDLSTYPKDCDTLEARGLREFSRLQARGLTARECEVAFWVAQGKRDAEIAVILGCASRTVSKHVENLLAKTGAETRLGASHVLTEWLHGGD